METPILRRHRIDIGPVPTLIKGRNIIFTRNSNYASLPWRCICRTESGSFAVKATSDLIAHDIQDIWDSSDKKLPALIKAEGWKRIGEEIITTNLWDLFRYEWEVCTCRKLPETGQTPKYMWFCRDPEKGPAIIHQDPIFGFSVAIQEKHSDAYIKWADAATHILTVHVNGGIMKSTTNTVIDPWPFVWFCYNKSYTELEDIFRSYKQSRTKYDLRRTMLDVMWTTDRMAFTNAVEQAGLLRRFKREYLTSVFCSVCRLTLDEAELLTTRMAALGFTV